MNKTRVNNANILIRHTDFRILIMVFGLQMVGCDHPPPSTVVPPKVIVSPVAKIDGVRDFRLSGTLSAERSTVLSFSVAGTVQEVFVHEGESVRKGQILARLSPRFYQDALGIAKAKADQAEDAFRRLEPMYRNKTLAEVKMVEVETGRKQARLALAIAERNLQDTVLRTPIGGVVARRHAEPGTTATPGLPAITLVQIRTMLATAPIPEIHIAKLKKGALAKVHIPALGKTIEGTVHQIGVIADPLTRTYEVKIALPNPSGALRIGMIAEVRLSAGKQRAGLWVPPEAVRVDEAGKPYLFVVSQNQKIIRRQVEVAGFVGEGTALSGGVSQGELVVTSGTPMLAEGLEVRISNKRAEVN